MLPFTTIYGINGLEILYELLEAGNGVDVILKLFTHLLLNWSSLHFRLKNFSVESL